MATQGTLISGERTCSMEAIAAAARRLAGGLQSLKIRRGDAVAVILRNDFPYFVLHEASHYLGFDVVPVNWRLKPAEIDYLLADCKAKAVVIHADLLSPALVEVIRHTLVIVVATPAGVAASGDAGENEYHDFLCWEDWLEKVPEVAPQEKSVRLPLFYTSGSSGRPKAVLRRHLTPEIGLSGNLRARFAWGLDKTPIRSVLTGPLYHSAPNGYANLVLQAGGALVLTPRFDAESLLALIERYAITHLHLVPTMFVRLLALPAGIRDRYRLDSLTHVAHGAAPCPEQVKRRMIDWWGNVIYEYYAMTETGIITCCNAAEWLQRPGTVGRPPPGVTIAIRDGEGNPLEPREQGAICVKHEGIDGVSYLNAQEKSLRQNGFLVTGDIGYLDEEGFLYICSRQSDLVISGGVNIYPAEIEAALLAMENVVDCAVFGVPDPEYGEKLVAVIEKSGSLSETDISAHLRARLANFKVPKRCEFVARLPRDDAGKIRKQHLRQEYLAKCGQ